MRGAKSFSFLVAVACCLAVVAGLWMYLLNWPRTWDISLWDETVYMSRGIYEWGGLFANYEGSPLYSAIYHLAHRAIASPIDLFYRVGLFGVVGATLAVFASVWSISRDVVVATCLAGILILAGFVMVEPRLIYPTIVILCIGAAVAFQMQAFAARAAVLALATFLGTFIRPEFALAFYVCSALAVVSAAWSITKDRRTGLMPALACLAIVAALSVLWCFPVIHGGDRAMEAFGQHYSFYYTWTRHVNIDPFLNWKPIVAAQLPGVSSEGQALFKYPGEILSFFWFNAWSLCKYLFDASRGFVLAHPLFTVSSAIALFVLPFVPKLKGESRPAQSAHWLGDLILWGALALPLLTSIVLISARLHYMMILTAVGCVGLSLVSRRVRRVPKVGGLLIAAALVASVKPAPEIDRPNLRVIEALKTQKPFGFAMEIDGGYCFYTPGVCSVAFANGVPGNESLSTFIEKQGVRAVFDSKHLISYATGRQDAEFVNFLESPHVSGWTRTDLGNGVTLLRKD